MSFMNFRVPLFKIYIYLIAPFGLLFSSYNITGYVYDTDTNKPIQNAQIILENQNIGSTTDIEGYFNSVSYTHLTLPTKA